MKTKIQNLFIALAVFSLIQSAEAQLSYTTNNGAITITGYTGPGGAVTIPNTTNGYPVTSLGVGAFYGTTITSVAIPNSVTNIGSEVFGNCIYLTAITVDSQNSFYSSVNGVLFDKNQTTLIECPGGLAGSYTIPNSVTSIGADAFIICISLTSVTIPNSVTNIGIGVFEYCGSLTSVSIGSGLSNLGSYEFYNCSALTSVYFQGNAPTPANDSTVFSGDTMAKAYYLLGATGWGGGGSTFDGIPEVSWQTLFNYTTTNGAVAITGYIGSDSAVFIPSTINDYPVTTIGVEAFDSYTSLTSVTIPDSVTTIGVAAFYNCTRLTRVAIGSGLSSIGNVAFLDCTTLTAITVDTQSLFFSSVYGVLFNKNQTTLVAYPEGLTAGSYTIPNSVTNIGANAFENCSGLTNVTIPDSVTSIGDYAFSSCTSLATVTIPDSVTYIGNDAFYGMTIASITIPNSVTDIGNEAFLGCTNLTAITVDAQNSLYSSVNGVLFNKDQTMIIDYPGGLAGSYTIPNSVILIGYEAFLETKITSVIIPDSVTITSSDAFGDCASLTSVTIGNGLIGIQNDMFIGCTSLTNVTIGSGVTSIGASAFAYCYALTSVYFLGNAPTPTNDSSVFSGDTSAKAYYLPGATSWSSTFDGIPAVLWNAQAQASGGGFGIQANRFGFNITGTANIPIVVEASTNLAGGTWLPLLTCTLTNGSIHFSDSAWTNFPSRFYRIRSQ